MAKQKNKKAIVEKPKQAWLWPTIIFVFSFLLYSNTLKHEYALDDDIYCLKNKYVQEGLKSWKPVFTKSSLHGFNGDTDSQYRPFPLFNFMVEIAFFGNSTTTHHFFNILLYSFVCLLLFKLLQKLFKNYHISVPIIITLLFAAHPVHSDVVSSIKSRDELWSFFWGLIAFIQLMNYSENQKTKSLAYSCIAFFLSTLSKENSLMFAFVFPLLLFFFTETPFKKIVRICIPYMGIVLLYYIIRSSVLEAVTFKQEIIVMNNALMAAKDKSEMLASNFVILLKYLRLLVFPLVLSWDYSYNSIPVMGWANLEPLLSLALYGAMGVYTVLNFKKKDVFVFCILFYLLTLFLASNLLFKINSTMAERFLFAPTLGFVIPLVLLTYKLFKADLTIKPNTNIILVASIVIGLYSIRTYSRNPVWKNNTSLFASGIESNPSSARCWFALSGEQKTNGDKAQDPKEKERWYKLSLGNAMTGLKIYDDPDILYNVGNTYYAMNQYDSALTYFKHTNKLKPKLVGSINNTGVIYFIRQQYDTAKTYFMRSINIDPNFADAYGNLGAVYHNKNMHDSALVYYQKALGFNPRNVNVMGNMTKIFANRGDTANANALQRQIQAIQQGR